MADQAAKRQSSTSQEIETSSDHTPTSNPDIFSDEFALEPFEVQSDSSPSSPDQNVASPIAPTNIPRRLGGSHRTSDSARESSRRSRSSLAYSGSRGFLPRRERPLSQNITTSNGSVSDFPKMASAPQRSVSTASKFSIPRVQSPYQGATGPSHPYGMYPQDIEIVRNPSSATNTTVRMPERPYVGPDGPTHPYVMYSQNITSGDRVGLDSNMIRPIPGFPGQDQNYQRRFGHDGEEAADLVGPDGYTEQLPPYSRYANDIPPKNGASVDSGIEGEPGNQPGGLQDTLNTALSRNLATGASIAHSSSTQLNPSADEAPLSTEGGHFKERVKEKGKKRICYGKIPMWVFMVFLLFAAALLGAVIGGVLGHAGTKSSDSDSAKPIGEYAPVSTITATTVTTTSLVDAIPITSTTDLPSLPTGSYQISLDNLHSNNNECLRTENQENAWDCNTKATMDIQVNCSDPNQLEISFSYYDDVESSQDARPRYGPQPPGFSGFVNMTPMIAKGDEERGPAYVFQHEFDKLVILHENVFLNPTNTKRWLRNDYEDDKSLDKRDDANYDFVDNSDKPWYCFWNGTVLEGFIFVTKDLANSTNTTTPINLNSSTIFFNENETTFSTLTGSFPSLTLSLLPSAASSSEISAAHFTSRPWKKRQQTDPTPVGITNAGISKYPKVIKIEERRNVQNDGSPYCQQMKYSEDTLPIPIDGHYFEMEELENDSIATGGQKRRRGWSKIFSIFKRSTDEWSSSCGCVWVSK